ncbi:MAG: glycerophosphodiester phosphodiesterase [Candidatus Omnitrophica bacterium]|nr:glycerophosphodiester phosphodiesterase [Candidatus Omnitrophota bacterium]
MRHIASRHGGILVIAHRGASAEAPEGTRAAIRLALRYRADMIELDVQMTRDRRLVIFHDDRLERTTDGRGRLGMRRYAELARLEAGAWFAPRFSGERILLASQALSLIPPPRRINLELKRTARRRALIRQLVRRVRGTRTAGRVLISSFDAGLLGRVKAAAPRLARALLCRDRPRRALRRAIRLQCRAFHPHVSLVSPSLVADAHAAGLRVHAWTVDDPQEARRLARMGIDGLFTNVPARIRAALSRIPR